jgi:hypothetical protein
LRFERLLLRTHSTHSDGSQRGALIVRKRGGRRSGCRLRIVVIVLWERPRNAANCLVVHRPLESVSVVTVKDSAVASVIGCIQLSHSGRDKKENARSVSPPGARRDVLVWAKAWTSCTVPYHRFRVGQTVVAPSGGAEGLIPYGPYVIVRCLPVVGGEPRYRVKSSVDGHERALLESQIRLFEETPAARPARQVPGGGKARHPASRRRGARW